MATMSQALHDTAVNPGSGTLFITFLKVGLTAFGGPAIMVYIRKVIVNQKRWLDDTTFRGGMALCQAIPGATNMQMAAYTGLKLQGIKGACVSFIGFMLPAFVFMLILSYGYSQTHNIQFVSSAFRGLQAIVVAIIASAAVTFGKNYARNWQGILLALLAAVLFYLKINPIMVIIICGAAGILAFRNKLAPKLNISGGQISTLGPVLIILAIAATGFILLFFLNRDLFDLAAIMIRIDLFAFGGGLASLPLMFHEIVNVRSWLDAQTFLNGIALGQITPGPIVITATFVGYMLYGFAGGVIATISIFLPSFLLVIGIAPYYEKLRSSSYFSRVIEGILCSFIGLLLSTTIILSLQINWDIIPVILAIAAFTALMFKIEIYWIVLVGIGISIWLL